jgi:hypothetical protein
VVRVEGPAPCRRRGRDLAPPGRPRRTPPHDQASAGLRPIRSTGGCVARSSDPRTRPSTRRLRATPSPARSSLPGRPLRDLACRSGLDGAAGQPKSPPPATGRDLPRHPCSRVVSHRGPESVPRRERRRIAIPHLVINSCVTHEEPTSHGGDAREPRAWPLLARVDNPEFVDRSPVPGHTLQSDGTMKRGPRVAGCADHSGWVVAIRNNWFHTPQLDYRHRLDAGSLHYSWLPEDPESKRSLTRGSPVRLFSRRPPCRSPPAPVRDHIPNPTAAHHFARQKADLSGELTARRATLRLDKDLREPKVSPKSAEGHGEPATLRIAMWRPPPRG